MDNKTLILAALVIGGIVLLVQKHREESSPTSSVPEPAESADNTPSPFSIRNAYTLDLGIIDEDVIYRRFPSLMSWMV